MDSHFPLPSFGSLQFMMSEIETFDPDDDRKAQLGVYFYY